MITVLLFLVGWVVVAAPLALLWGAIIRDRDRGHCKNPEADGLMALVQPENVAPAERDLQTIERSWWA